MQSLTKTEKAHATRVKNVAQSIVVAIRAAGNDPRHVVAAFDATLASPEVLADAYTMLDRDTRWFGEDTRWHSALRACRNSPTFGPQLFALFC